MKRFLSPSAPVLVALITVASMSGVVGAAWAQSVSHSFPSTADHAVYFYPTAYMDHSGQDWACGGITLAGHDGTDFGIGGWGSMATGRQVAAAAAGTVIQVVDGFYDECTTGDCDGGELGNYLAIQHSDGTETYYGHLKQGSILPASGDEVACGEVLAEVGSSGASTGPHLHFEVRIGGQPTDPYFGSCSETTSSLWTIPGTYGGMPSVACEPLTELPEGGLIVDNQDAGFDFTNGSSVDDVDSWSSGGYASHYYGQVTASLTSPLVTGTWTPTFPQTGLYAVEAYIPTATDERATMALLNIAFMGGHAIFALDQSQETGAWLPVFADMAFKFVAGTRNHVTLQNVGGSATATTAWDALRLTYLGPEGTAGIGEACAYPNDCAGTATCYEGLCLADCSSAGCGPTEGVCEYASGVCIEGDPLDAEKWGAADPDADSDGDGLSDSAEGFGDEDGDGIPDAEDSDSDGDGIPDSDEGMGDNDHDGVPNFLDSDSDNDGLPDSVDGTADPEGDGYPAYLDPEADGDGIPDALEVCGDPYNPCDTDGDGSPDYLDSDSDNDGIIDYLEGIGDNDGDGIPDFQDLDSDGDGLPDSWEGADDSDGDGIPDYLDLDSDNDGIPDSDDADSDGDGLGDGFLTDPTADLGSGEAQPFAGCTCDAVGGLEKGAAWAWVFALLLARWGFRRPRSAR